MNWFVFVDIFFQPIKKVLQLNSILKISFCRGTNKQIIGVNSFQVNILKYNKNEREAPEGCTMVNVYQAGLDSFNIAFKAATIDK